MTLKENNNRITDQAWNKLYSRLEEDGLLSDVDNKPKQGTFHMTPLKWAAAIAVISICLAFAFIGRQSKQNHTIDMLTLSNDKDASTLVSTLEDGSMIYLSGSASLEYPPRFADDKREVILSGDAYFDISKDRKKPFIINTEKATIQVLGTAFNIKDKDPFSISVKHGEVKVTEKENGKFVFVKAGETAMLKAGNLYTMQTSDIEQFAKYFNSIHFKDQRLEDIARVLNTYSDSILIEVAPQVKDRLITMSFSDETKSDIVKYICMALNIEFIQRQNTIFITNRK
ncbi:FecR family protein [Dysgonomonas sp.]|jgi:ferric-dicitrate binding protein FerR (iron transport regulator)|nr:FecR family protein [Prevotella sp.]